MKFAIFSLLLFSFCSVNAQIIYLSADESFSIGNGARPTTQKAIWLKFTDGAASAEIVLASGKTLLRTFKKDIPQAYFVIVGEKVRYRPNMAILKADTILVDAQKAAVIIPQTAPSAISNELKLLCELAYEWEKTEKAKWICSTLNPSCDEIVAMLACLEYDASRVEIINSLAKTKRDSCRAAVQKTVSEPYRATLKTD